MGTIDVAGKTLERFIQDFELKPNQIDMLKKIIGVHANVHTLAKEEQGKENLANAIENHERNRNPKYQHSQEMQQMIDAYKRSPLWKVCEAHFAEADTKDKSSGQMYEFLMSAMNHLSNIMVLESSNKNQLKTPDQIAAIKKVKDNFALIHQALLDIAKCDDPNLLQKALMTIADYQDGKKSSPRSPRLERTHAVKLVPVDKMEESLGQACQMMEDLRKSNGPGYRALTEDLANTISNRIATLQMKPGVRHDDDNPEPQGMGMKR